VVELDGGQHSLQLETDQNRTAFLERRGYRVLRFWDHDALARTDLVLERITQILRESNAFQSDGK
jgi:very-short-patch-repair endonuclease